MPVTFSSFVAALQDSPALLPVALLTAAVVLVNGWTDAPNAIATAVSTGALPFRRAAVLAAACNLLGVLAATAGGAMVAETLYTIADFGGDPRRALYALCAALAGVVAWGTLAWRFGIPTSESHALVAGVSGAALAMPGGIFNLRAGAWGRVGAGLLLSLGLGLLLGRWWARGLSRRQGDGLYRRGQIAAAALMALLHGAQDGQKFIGVFLLGAALSVGGREGIPFAVPVWLAVPCAVLMALGTLAGGRRIVDTVGRDMTVLSPRTGLSADLGAACVLALCTLLGLPVSTTHAKTAAILGAGSQEGGVRWGVVRAICLTWLLTFPGCGALGFLLARIFLLLG